MRKLFWQMNVTLDGFMEGPNRELNDTAQVVDEDFERYCTEMLKSIDTSLLGRVTYQLFADYWPSATGPDADRLNELPKIVYSRTLEKVEWKNSGLVTGLSANPLPSSADLSGFLAVQSSEMNSRRYISRPGIGW